MNIVDKLAELVLEAKARASAGHIAKEEIKAVIYIGAAEARALEHDPEYQSTMRHAGLPIHQFLFAEKYTSIAGAEVIRVVKDNHLHVTTIS